MRKALVDAKEKFHKAGNYTKEFECLVALYADDKRKVYPMIQQFRRDMTAKVRDGEDVSANMNLLKRAYTLTGRDYFDDFMVALEWDRAANARFWLPRRKILEGKFHIASKIQFFINNKYAKMLAISCPPGTGKTTLIKFLLAFIAGKFPDSMNMYASYSDGMVKVMYDSLVSIMSDDSEYRFKEIFPELGKLETSAEYSTLSYRKKGDFPTLGLVSIGGSVTGRTRANKFFITDDLVKNDEVARSPERLNTLYADYTNTLTTRMIGEDVKQIMLGTVWSIHDPITRQKLKYEGKPGYDFIALPVCDEDGHSNFCYDHPDHYTDEMIADIKDRVDPVTFSCVYMQQGIEKEGLPFSKDKLKFYNGVLPDGEPDNIFFYADVAWGGGDSFSMPIAYQYGDDVYIHDVIFDTGDKSITKPRVVAKILEHKTKMGRFEANNGGAEYAEDIDKAVKQQHYSMNISSKRAAGNTAKLVRIEQHQSTIRNFYYRAEGYRDKEYDRFMSELQTFSFTSKNLHDDAADALAGMAGYMFDGNCVAAIIKRPF